MLSISFSKSPLYENQKLRDYCKKINEESIKKLTSKHVLERNNNIDIIEKNIVNNIL